MSSIEAGGTDHHYHRHCHAEIAAALQKEVERVGSEYSLFVLEHHAQRPLKYMPEIILDDLALSQVSIFAAQTQPRELGSRTEMTSVVNHHQSVTRTW